MIHNKAENYCVKINCNGKIGSGVLIPSDTTFYVFTAAHCLGTTKPSIDEVEIEKQSDYQSDFKRIDVVGIKEYDLEKDFALIEIDFKDEDKFLYQYKLAYGVIPDTNVSFCGYQGINNRTYRPFPSKVITSSETNNCFRITLTEGETFHQGGENGQFIAAGLSGSGVFVYRHETPFLIGILNSVQTEQAWNSDVNCCAVYHIKEYIKDYIDLSDLSELKSWKVNLDKKYTENEIEAFKSTDSDFFNRLYRKNQVLYTEHEKANRITIRQIKKYLSMLNNIRQFDNEAPNLYIKFKEIVNRYVDQVEDDYTRTVNDNQEAIDKKNELQQRLKEDLDFLPQYINLDFSDYQIIEWLGMCTLNFTKDD